MDERIRDMTGLPGFGPGTHLMTTGGELPVEWLATGDRLITRDHGAQPILWIGRAHADPALAQPPVHPVEIAEGALGDGCPTHATWLAPAHRVLLSGAMVQLHAGVDEALAEIGGLRDGRHVARTTPGATQYTLVLLPMHDMVQANGLWAETLLLDPATRDRLLADIPGHILAMPSLALGHARAARPCLRHWEVTAMSGRRPDHGLSLIRHVA